MFDWVSPSGTSPAAGDALEQLLQTARLCCRIFFSLNIFGLSELYESCLKEWMDLFHQCLILELPAAAAAAAADPERESPLDSLKAAVCANANLYMEKEEDSFEPFMQTFVQDVWSQLVKAGFGGDDAVGSSPTGCVSHRDRYS